MEDADDQAAVEIQVVGWTYGRFGKTPTRVRVFIDGKNVGTITDTERHSLPITPGIHKVGVECYGYRSKNREVSLAPGDRASLECGSLKGLRSGLEVMMLILAPLSWVLIPRGLALTSIAASVLAFELRNTPGSPWSRIRPRRRSVRRLDKATRISRSSRQKIHAYIIILIQYVCLVYQFVGIRIFRRSSCDEGSGHVPEAYAAVHAAGGEHPPVSREGQRFEAPLVRGRMPVPCPRRLPTRRRPHPRGPWRAGPHRARTPGPSRRGASSGASSGFDRQPRIQRRTVHSRKLDVASKTPSGENATEVIPFPAG